jgi:hypothetical protein
VAVIIAWVLKSKNTALASLQEREQKDGLGGLCARAFI